MPIETPSDPTAARAVSIHDAGMTVRSINLLRSLGIKSLGELASRSRMDLLRVRGCGRKTLRDMELVLAENGLGFAASSAHVPTNPAAYHRCSCGTLPICCPGELHDCAIERDVALKLRLVVAVERLARVFAPEG